MILHTLAFIGLTTVIIIVVMILIALWDMWRREKIGGRVMVSDRELRVPVDTWLCPSCGEPVEYQQKLGDNVLYHGQHDFCPKCGQAIEWEENEE